MFSVMRVILHYHFSFTSVTFGFIGFTLPKTMRFSALRMKPRFHPAFTIINTPLPLGIGNRRPKGKSKSKAFVLPSFYVANQIVGSYFSIV